jgi:hypothetical protein
LRRNTRKDHIKEYLNQDGDGWTATWWCGMMSGVRPGHAASQNLVETFIARMLSASKCPGPIPYSELFQSAGLDREACVDFAIRNVRWENGHLVGDTRIRHLQGQHGHRHAVDEYLEKVSKMFETWCLTPGLRHSICGSVSDQTVCPLPAQDPGAAVITGSGKSSSRGLAS